MAACRVCDHHNKSSDLLITEHGFADHDFPLLLDLLGGHNVHVAIRDPTTAPAAEKLLLVYQQSADAELRGVAGSDERHTLFTLHKFMYVHLLVYN